MKLKGIDGGPHKQWSMWFNSTQREEPYQVLTSCDGAGNSSFLRDAETGGAWLSSARVVRCWVKSRNERNPRPVLPARYGGNSRGTAGVNSEEGGDDVRSSCPLRPGLHACYNGRYSGMRHGDMERIPENRSQFGSEPATRLREGGVASNRGSATPR